MVSFVIILYLVKWMVCRALSLEMIEERPYTTILTEKQKENLELMRTTDVILITVGYCNVNNYRDLRRYRARYIYIQAA